MVSPQRYQIGGKGGEGGREGRERMLFSIAVWCGLHKETSCQLLGYVTMWNIRSHHTPRHSCVCGVVMATRTQSARKMSSSCRSQNVRASKRGRVTSPNTERRYRVCVSVWVSVFVQLNTLLEYLQTQWV